jgi:hypothetical protein
LFDDYNIIAGSFGVTDQDAKRLSEVWCYYTQRNPTDTGAKEDNFKNVLVDLDLGRETEYGGSMIRKTQCRWIQTEAAASRYTLLQLGRYKDPPRSYAFDVVAGTSVSPAGGYTLEWWGEQDTSGNRASVPIQITQVTMYPDRVHVEAEEMLVDGSIVVSLLNVMFVYTGTTTVARPATWNDADNSIHAISSGSCGDCHDNTNRKGGGGAAWAALDNYTMAASVSCSVGAAQTNATAGYGVDGQPTWFVSTGTLYADYPRATGVGGQAASSIGDRKYSGGNGGSYNGGGGGAGGPHGAGANGGNGVFYPSIGGGGGGADGGYPGANGSGDTPGDGGNNRYNFGGGTSGSPNGSVGGGGRGGTPVTHAGNGGDGEQIWTQTTPPIVSAGPGGGSGGKFPSTAGRYGGGAGAAYDAHSSADGLLVLVWRTV